MICMQGRVLSYTVNDCPPRVKVSQAEQVAPHCTLASHAKNVFCRSLAFGKRLTRKDFESEIKRNAGPATGF